MKKTLLYLFVWTLIGSSFGHVSLGQSSVVRTLKVVDGLPDNSVSALLVDADGATWIGTQNGLVQFDGVTIRPVTPDIGRDIRALLQAPDGAVWAAEYSRGIYRIDPLSRTSERVVELDENVLKMGISADGTIWIGTESSLFHLDQDSNQLVVQRLPVQDMEIRAVHGTANGDLWVGGPSGYGRVFQEEGRWRAPVADWRTTIAVDSVYVSSIADGPDGTLWIGTQGHGLNLVDPVTDTVTSYIHDRADVTTIGNDYVYDILPQDDAVWVAGLYSDGQAGLSRFDPDAKEFERYRFRPADPESVGSFGGLSLAEAPDGSVLAGFIHGGLTILSPEGLPVQFWNESSRNTVRKLPSVDVGAVLPMNDGTVLVGFLGDGLYRRTSETGVSVPIASPVSYVLDLAPGADGTTWMAAWSGLYALDSALAPRQVLLETGNRQPNIFTLEPTMSGAVWAGSNQGRLYRLGPDGVTVDRFVIDGMTRLDRVEGISVDGDGRVWAAVGGHLYWMRMDDDSFSEVQIDGLDMDIRFVDVDPSGDVWLGTRYDGVARLDVETGKIDWVTEATGLLYNGISGLVVDNHGCVWIATERGLHGLAPSSMELSVYPSTALTTFNKFELHRIAVEGDTDVVYMAGLMGIVRLDSEAVSPESPPLTVRISNVLTDGNVTDWDRSGRVSLDASTRWFALDVAVPVYTQREDVRYQYRLAGQSDWIMLEDQHVIDLSAAGPGRHRIEVQARTSNVEGPVGALSVDVAWPWWQAPWMRVVWIVLLLAAAAGAAARRMWRTERERELLERTVEERTVTVRQQADRLQALDSMKSRFFANISHEFRTPLTLILGPVDDALSGRWGDVDHDQKDDLTMIRRQGRRLLALVNQLLDLATLDAGRMVLNKRPVDIVRLTRTAVQTFSSLAHGSGVTLRFKSSVEARVTTLDAERMEQVLYNLIGNAIKFTPDGGSVMVSLEELDGELCISVRDTGPGIAAANQPFVFDRFYQVEREGSSRRSGGIGLALAHELVELHGGRIMLVSDPGFGATFSVMLPVDAPDSVALNAPDDFVDRPESDSMLLWEADADIRLEDAGPDGRPVVLIVEDHPDVASYIARSLAGAYRCHIAGNGDEGLEWARQLKPDLVVSDVMMPGMDGYALCQAIKSDEALRTIPVILLTARADEESKMEGLGAGADDYLYKPFSGSELRLRAENLIEVRRILRDSLRDGGFRVQASDVEVPSDDDVFAQKAQAVVEGQLDNTQFGATWLADELGISPRHLQRRLKDITGLSTNAFIRTLRLQRAHQLLDKGAGNVSEVAYAVGYTDPKYFSRIFRQAYGVPPSQIDT